MRLSELRGATSFRLALFFAAVFGTASLIFVASVYVMASQFLTGNPDERMRAEAMKFDSRSGNQTEQVLDQHSVDDVTGRRPFGLFDAQGRWLAGNLHRLPEPHPVPESFFESEVHTPQEHTFYRSILHRLPGGNFVVVSRNIEELQKFRHELLEATLLALALMMVLGVAGGTMIGVGSLRRLDKVIRAIEGITRGDLAGRLPSRGTNDDVDRLVRVVNSMLDQIERLMGEVKGVCDSIAHDLRTPLTRLLAALERANRRTLSAAERRAEIEEAIAEVRLMLRTFAALLRISEIEDGARRASFSDVDLGQVVSDAVDYYEPAADAKNIALSFVSGPADERHLISGDIDLLFEAVGNLIDNAIKFTPAGGAVSVTLRPGAAIVVADTGCGIAPGQRQNVKLRFHRGDRARETSGNGLGLPLVGAIARLHGMELHFEDGEPGCRVVVSPIVANDPGEPGRLSLVHTA
ncbi:ATP-binding protein [Sphingomonas sp. AR_OL41]|uniref:sensor histidine kinase n=1 Tax=Sphingomonas sp. AR_OL41 TaxID=3042729 RepID=UPI00247FC5E8|nr:ATP-binding protein [Sphingomonas sp. AR_OL41]MDH7974476.1 ATP-binding protein [Sphingomonas sp. AR_OL41]